MAESTLHLPRPSGVWPVDTEAPVGSATDTHIPAASSLASNVKWTLAGNICYSGSQWALLSALAKMGTTEQVGALALGLAITSPLFVAGQLNLRGVQATDATNQFSFGDYLGLRYISTAAALLVTVAVALGFGYRWSIALIIILTGFMRAFDNLSDIYYGALFQHERMARIGKSMIAKGALALVALMAAVRLSHNVIWATAALALVSALMFAFYDRRSVTFGARPEWHPSGYRALFRLAFPLAVVMILVSVNLNLPRYFIERYRGEAELGVFAALSYLIAVGNTVVNAAGQATTPRLAKLFAFGPRSRFWTLLCILLCVGLSCGGLCIAAVAVAGKRILTLLYTPGYAAYARLLLGVMGVATLMYPSVFLGCGMTAARIFRAQVPLFVVVVVATGVACWALIPARGLMGAVMAMALGFVVQFLGGAAILAYHSILSGRFRET